MTWPVGNVGGVRVEVHASALGAVVVATSVLALGLLPVTAQGQPAVLHWSAGLAVALAFFATVVVHELAHAAAARRYGIMTHRIVLWLLGASGQSRPPPPHPRADAVIAVAGPAASVAMGSTCWAVALAVEPLLAPAAIAALLWLGLANLAFAVFTLLPGAPLDGGRLVRAAVWRWTGDRDHAESVARRSGRVLGSALVACGAATVILFGQFVGLWLAVAGWVLLGTKAAVPGETGEAGEADETGETGETGTVTP